MYRGIANRTLPHSFLNFNEHNVRGGVEFAFMSTTPKKDVAREYASRGVSNQTAIIFEVQMGMVDRGADISWLSQYPHEQEICFAPLTSITVENMSALPDAQILEVRLNINLNALTLEKVSECAPRPTPLATITSIVPSSLPPTFFLLPVAAALRFLLHSLCRTSLRLHSCTVHGCTRHRYTQNSSGQPSVSRAAGV